MKLIKILTLLAFFSLSSSLMAQETDDEIRSLFKMKSGQKLTHGAYGAFGVGHTLIADKNALRLTFKGAWLVNHRFALGIAGNGFFNDIGNSTNTINNAIGGGYGGLFFEPILFPEAPVHVTFPIIIGGGGVTTLPPNEWHDNIDNSSNKFDAFFVVEPGIEIEINMVKYFRIGLGVSYRITNDINLSYDDLSTVPAATLNGFNLYANFKFGKF